jgi:Alpha-N-acetylglucosaminidase (NAGLU) tim-barrel domain
MPIHFRKLFPNANFSVVEKWNNFPPKYCCPLFVDPIEPLFQEIGHKFLSRLTQKYGTNHIFFKRSLERGPTSRGRCKLFATSFQINLLGYEIG